MSPGVTVLLAVSVALNVIMMYREVNRYMWKRKRKRRGGRGRAPYRSQQRQRQRQQ